MSGAYSATLAALIVYVALDAVPSAQQRASVPDAPAEQAARKAAGEIYGGRFRQVKTSAEKTALAAEMIEAAAKVQDGSPDQYMLLKIAADIASGAGDAPTALQAVEKTVERFDVPGPKLRAETLLAAARNATTSSQQKAVGEAMLSIVDAVADADECELALSLCEAARSSAQKTRQYALAKELTGKIEEIKKRHSMSQEYRDAWAVLEKDPTNPAANLAAGRYLCFVKGDWDRSVPMLALGSDAKLKDVAVKDLRGANTAEEQAAIGDAWWALAETKQGAERDQVRMRAGAWYHRAEPKLAGGLVGLKIQQRLTELAKLGRDIPQLGEATASVSPPPLAIAPFDEATAKRHQAAWAKHLGVPVETTNPIGMRFVLIPPGEFDMGTTAELVDQLAKEAESRKEAAWVLDGLRSETPRHRVRLTGPFYLSVCEVTQMDFERVMGFNPSKFKGNPNCPVETITWDEVTAFCSKLTELPRERAAHAEYRLPMEAEWEHACRAGTTTQFSFGDNAEALTISGWWQHTSQSRPQPVGQLRPNAWGLYDMHGNVWERCQDWWGKDYYGTSPVADPTGPASGSKRVIRGGACHDLPYFCLSSSRRDCGLGERYAGVGFRVVRTVSAAPAGR